MSEQSDSRTRYLSFALGSEYFAIPLLEVKEVIALADVTPIPFTPEYLLGIMNLRGQVISVIDLRKKFGIKTNKSTETAVIICHLSPLCLGIVVDSVDAVLAPASNELSAKPEIESNIKTDYITHVFQKDARLILFLNLAKTLSVEEHLAYSAQPVALAASPSTDEAAA